MRFLLDQFMDHLVLERGLSENTRLAYGHDLSEFLAFLSRRGRAGIQEVERRDILDFLMEGKQKGLAAASLARRLVAIKVFFRHLSREGLLATNAADAMDSPRLWKILHRAQLGDEAAKQRETTRQTEQLQAVRPAVQISGAGASRGGVRDELGTREWMQRRNDQALRGR